MRDGGREEGTEGGREEGWSGMGSEESHDYVREAKSAEQEEVEERIFVPSATSVPQKPFFRCDNQCNGKTLGFCGIQ